MFILGSTCLLMCIGVVSYLDKYFCQCDHSKYPESNHDLMLLLCTNLPDSVNIVVLNYFLSKST